MFQVHCFKVVGIDNLREYTNHGQPFPIPTARHLHQSTQAKEVLIVLNKFAGPQLLIEFTSVASASCSYNCAGFGYREDTKCYI